MVNSAIFILVCAMTVWFINSYYNVLKSRSCYLASIKKSRVSFIAWLVFMLGVALFPAYSWIAILNILFLYTYFLILAPELLYLFLN